VDPPVLDGDVRVLTEPGLEGETIELLDGRDE